MDTDSTPLINKDERDLKDEGNVTPDFKKMVFFHGKELSGRSFIRQPQHNVVRIGVGIDGVYKLDSKTPRVLQHWKYPNIKDSSYSGYSFTLKLCDGGEYYMRTDDGEPLCTYIELFQKDPALAVEQARNNPPMSKVPESGVATLRRKFSSEPQNDVKFFTLNRRPKNSSNNPTTDLLRQHNIEVDSRLRTGYHQILSNKVSGSDPDVRKRGHSLDTPRPHSMGPTGLQNHSSDRSVNVNEDSLEDKMQQARGVISNKIASVVESEKRLSNGIRGISPVSTKGEVTTVQSTKVSPSSSKSHGSKSLQPKVTKPGGAYNNPTTAATTTKPELPKFTGDSLTSDTLSDMIPLVRPDSTTSSGGPFSPSDEFNFMSCFDEETLILALKDKSDTHSEIHFRSYRNNSDEIYDKLVPHEQHLSESEVSITPPISTTPTPANPDELRWSFSSNESGEYDHLPPPLDPSLEKIKQGLYKNNSDLDATYRRITSQPALSTPASARESPIDIGPRNLIPEETSEEDEDDEISQGELPEIGKPIPPLGDESYPSVVMRQKRNKHLDPFAEILSAQSRLRWSQELNPLYDYIKGYKISEGVRLYDSPASKLLHSTRAGDTDKTPTKDGGGGGRIAPSIIVEEESETSSREQTVSPNESQTEEDTKSESEAPNATLTLPRMKKPHIYEEISFADVTENRPASEMGMVEQLMKRGKMKSLYDNKEQQKAELKSSSLRSDVSSAHQQRLKTLEKAGVSPRIGKRELLQNRRSRTISSLDDTAAEKRKQRPVKAGDVLKDFSFVMREYRLFYIMLPNGQMIGEIFNINKPLCELKEKLCDMIGADNAEHYHLYMVGACMTTLKETEGAGLDGRVNRLGSLSHFVDHQSLPDQGAERVHLKPNLSFRMQGITTSRILTLLPDDEATDTSLSLSNNDVIFDYEDEFHKNWMSIVHGNVPCSLDDAVKLAALQYQSYFLDRTAVHSVVGFCRPTEFLPHEYAGIRGIEQKMYKEQEILKMKSHKDIKMSYNTKCTKLLTYNAVFFPAREPRRKLLSSTKLKPIIIGVSSHGILRVDAKTKEVLDFWDYSVLKNWAYSKRTFVLAFTNKNYPVEANQAKWICQLIDFHVDALVGHAANRPRASSDAADLICLN